MDNETTTKVDTPESIYAQIHRDPFPFCTVPAPYPLRTESVSPLLTKMSERPTYHPHELKHHTPLGMQLMLARYETTWDSTPARRILRDMGRSVVSWFGEDTDIFRKTWVRYCGYCNEVGEAFKSFLPRWAYLGTYGVSVAYCLGEAYVEQMELMQRVETDKLYQTKYFKLFGASLVWQLGASVILPGAAINRSVALARKLLNLGKVSAALRAIRVPNVFAKTSWGHHITGLKTVQAGGESAAKTVSLYRLMDRWFPTLLGLGLIPLIVEPIDHVVDNWTSRSLFPKLHIDMRDFLQRECHQMDSGVSELSLECEEQSEDQLVKRPGESKLAFSSRKYEQYAKTRRKLHASVGEPEWVGRYDEQLRELSPAVLLRMGIDSGQDYLRLQARETAKRLVAAHRLAKVSRGEQWAWETADNGLGWVPWDRKTLIVDPEYRSDLPEDFQSFLQHVVALQTTCTAESTSLDENIWLDKQGDRDTTSQKQASVTGEDAASFQAPEDLWMCPGYVPPYSHRLARHWFLCTHNLRVPLGHGHFALFDGYEVQQRRRMRERREGGHWAVAWEDKPKKPKFSEHLSFGVVASEVDLDTMTLEEIASVCKVPPAIVASEIASAQGNLGAEEKLETQYREALSARTAEFFFPLLPCSVDAAELWDHPGLYKEALGEGPYFIALYHGLHSLRKQWQALVSFQMTESERFRLRVERHHRFMNKQAPNRPVSPAEQVFRDTHDMLQSAWWAYAPTTLDLLRFSRANEDQRLNMVRHQGIPISEGDMQHLRRFGRTSNQQVSAWLDKENQDKKEVGWPENKIDAVVNRVRDMCMGGDTQSPDPEQPSEASSGDDAVFRISGNMGPLRMAWGMLFDTPSTGDDAGLKPATWSDWIRLLSLKNNPFMDPSSYDSLAEDRIALEKAMEQREAEAAADSSEETTPSEQQNDANAHHHHTTAAATADGDSRSAGSSKPRRERGRETSVREHLREYDAAVAQQREEARLLNLKIRMAKFDVVCPSAVEQPAISGDQSTISGEEKKTDGSFAFGLDRVPFRSARQYCNFRRVVDAERMREVQKADDGLLE